MPVVVHPATAIAKSDAATALIDTELMVSLLSSQKRMTAIAAPAVEQSSSVSASVNPVKFMGSLAFLAIFRHRRAAGARPCRCACTF
jgi:hypothetical protein